MQKLLHLQSPPRRSSVLASIVTSRPAQPQHRLKLWRLRVITAQTIATACTLLSWRLGPHNHTMTRLEAVGYTSVYARSLTSVVPHQLAASLWCAQETFKEWQACQAQRQAQAEDLTDLRLTSTHCALP